ncbi:hypothetical protein WA026_001230 [Henosepilachna vigintioctopunctata]|uniref:Uncharacterized protein n=1 Tax=Henosepilachna vigintioctopunctata TaxID=420089 RepID=A0AAW1UHN9_9CUCU
MQNNKKHMKKPMELKRRKLKLIKRNKLHKNMMKTKIISLVFPATEDTWNQMKDGSSVALCGNWAHCSCAEVEDEDDGAVFICEYCIQNSNISPYTPSCPIR